MSNKEIEDILNVGWWQSLEDGGLLIKGVTQIIKNITEQKGEFLSMLSDTLCSSLLGNLVTGKGMIALSQGQGVICAGEKQLQWSRIFNASPPF